MTSLNLDQSESPTKTALDRTWLLALLLAILCLGAYANSFLGAFVYDDGYCLFVRDALSEWWPEKLSTGTRRWFTHLTFVANYKAHGYWTPGYHLVNNLIHLLAGLFLFGLVRRTLLLPATRERYAAAANWLALAVAAIWLVHPLQSESVTYIVQRLESLSGMFFLFTLYALLRGATANRAWPWYLLMIAAVMVGFGAKETMFVAPLVALAFDRCYLAASWRELCAKRWWVYLCTVPALVWAGYMTTHNFTPGAKTSIGFAFKGVSPWEYLRSQPAVILHYLRLCFWPDQQCLDYFWQVENDPFRIYGFGAVIVALLAVTVFALWKLPRLGFIGLAFFVILAPTSSFMPIRDLAFEHRMYLPLASVATIVVLAVYELCKRTLKLPTPRVALPAALLTFVVLALALLTSQRNKVYQDPASMWKDVTISAPHSSRAFYNLGKELTNRGFIDNLPKYKHLLVYDVKKVEIASAVVEHPKLNEDLEQAIVAFRQSIKLAPNDPSAYFNIGGIYDRTGHPAEAIEAYRGELNINPKHPNARLNLAHLLAAQGQAEEAIREYRTAIKMFPQDPRCYSGLAKLLTQRDSLSEAEELFKTALAIDPDHKSSQLGIANLYWKQGEQAKAIAQLRTLRRKHPTIGVANLTLAKFLVETDVTELHQPAEAALLAQGVIDAGDKTNFEAWSIHVTSLAQLKRYDEAVAKLDRAIELATAAKAKSHLDAFQTQREALRALTAAPNVGS